MTFDQFKKEYIKLNALLNAVDEKLTDLYQELPITDAKRAKNLIKTGRKFADASFEYWSRIEEKKISKECVVANYQVYESFKEYINEYFNEFYKE